MKQTKALCPLYYISLKKVANVAFAAPDYLITYKELNCLANFLCFFLKKKNLYNKNLLLVTENSILLSAFYFAALKSHNSIIPLNMKASSLSKLSQTTLSNIDLVVGDIRWLKCIKNNTFCEFFSWQDLQGQLIRQFNTFLLHKFYSHNINIYCLHRSISGIFTSGSTGEPKICYHNFSNHIWSSIGLNKYIKLNYLDKWLLTLPLYHVSGLNIILRAFLNYSAVILAINFHNKQSIKYILQNSKASFLSVVNTQLYRIRAFPFSKNFLEKLNCLLIGGSKPNTKILNQYKLFSNTLLFFTYGLSETFSQVYITKITPPFLSFLLPYRQFKIFNKDNMLVRGRVLLQSYKYTKQRTSPFNKEFLDYFWLITKDIANIHFTHGCFIKGRRDYVFSRAGEKISPEEIEYELNKLPNILISVVIPIYNEEFDYVPIAYLYLQNISKFNETLIKFSLVNVLPKYKIPEKFLLMPLKFTLELKINRKLLQSYYYNNI